MQHLCLCFLSALSVCQRCQRGCAGLHNYVVKRGWDAGMGFIQSNHSVIMYNNTMISFNMLEVARIEGVKR